jgi:hypothetical protein
MKTNYYGNYFLGIFFFILIPSSNIFAQKRNAQLLDDTLANINRLLHKDYQHCFTNSNDSTERVTNAPDTIPYLKYSTPARWKYVEFEIDSLSKLAKKAKKEKRYQDEKYSDYQDLSKFEIERRYGIIWKIADLFDTTLCSNDYDFNADIVFNVNCQGKIYNIKLIKGWSVNDSKYHLSESYKFAFAVYKVMLTLRDNIILNPPSMKGDKNLNYRSHTININSKRKVVFLRHRPGGKDIPFWGCYTSTKQLR